jgi:hypothetical protein
LKNNVTRYDVTPIYAAYAKSGKIQMASSKERSADLGEAEIKKLLEKRVKTTKKLQTEAKLSLKSIYEKRSLASALYHCYSIFSSWASS